MVYSVIGEVGYASVLMDLCSLLICQSAGVEGLPFCFVFGGCESVAFLL